MSEPGAVTGAVLASQAASIERGQEAALIDGERWVLELVARGVPFDTVLTALARLIEAITGDGLIASIMLLDDDGATIRVGAAPGLPAAYCRQIDGVAIGPAAGSCGTAAYLGEPVIVSDIATDPLWDDYRHLALPRGWPHAGPPRSSPRKAVW
jgi:GAF domain-containing protein